MFLSIFQTAMPLDVRKSSAFPSDATQDQRGSAADPRHSLEDSLEDKPAKQSFAAHRQAEPENPTARYRVIGEPAALLERIIQASSNEGDIVLDPFAGCGTTIAAAEKLNRQWIGIDITQLSIALLKNHLEGNFGMLPAKDGRRVSSPHVSKGSTQFGDQRGALTDVRATDTKPTNTYRVIGEPEDLHDAKQLATENRYQFQYWALSQINA